MIDVKRKSRNNRNREREENVQAIYDYIAAYKAENGISPSLKEIARGCLMSRSNVVRYLDLLEARGYIERLHNLPRSIRIVATDDRL